MNYILRPWEMDDLEHVFLNADNPKIAGNMSGNLCKAKLLINN